MPRRIKVVDVEVNDEERGVRDTEPSVEPTHSEIQPDEHIGADVSKTTEIEQTQQYEEKDTNIKAEVKQSVEVDNPVEEIDKQQAVKTKIHELHECPKCGKLMTLKTLKYAHEKTCGSKAQAQIIQQDSPAKPTKKVGRPKKEALPVEKPSPPETSPTLSFEEMRQQYVNNRREQRKQQYRDLFSNSF